MTTFTLRAADGIELAKDGVTRISREETARRGLLRCGRALLRSGRKPRNDTERRALNLAQAEDLKD